MRLDWILAEFFTYFFDLLDWIFTFVNLILGAAI